MSKLPEEISSWIKKQQKEFLNCLTKLMEFLKCKKLKSASLPYILNIHICFNEYHFYHYPNTPHYSP